MGELDGDYRAMVKVDNIIEWAIRKQKTTEDLPEHYANWLKKNKDSTVKSDEVLTYIEDEIKKRTAERTREMLAQTAKKKKKNKGRTKKKATGAPRRHHTKGFHKTKKQHARKKSLAQSKKKKNKKKKGGMQGENGDGDEEAWETLDDLFLEDYALIAEIKQQLDEASQQIETLKNSKHKAHEKHLKQIQDIAENIQELAADAGDKERELKQEIYELNKKLEFANSSVGRLYSVHPSLRKTVQNVTEQNIRNANSKGSQGLARVAARHIPPPIDENTD